MNRVKFLLRAYLRVRLAKIEEHVLHIISSPGGVLLNRLSPAEQEFAAGCAGALLTTRVSMPVLTRPTHLQVHRRRRTAFQGQRVVSPSASVRLVAATDRRC